MEHFFFNCNFFSLLNSSAPLWFWVCSTMLTGSPCCTCNGNLISINWIWMNEATNEYIILLGASARPFKNHFRLSARRRNNMQLKPFDLLPPPIKTSERVLWGLRRSARGFEHDLTSPSTRKQPVNHKNNRYTASLFSPRSCLTFPSHKISLDIYSAFSLAAACKKNKTIFGAKTMKFTRTSILSLWLRAAHGQQKKSPSLFLLPAEAGRDPTSGKACQRISACEPRLFKNPNDQTNMCACACAVSLRLPLATVTTALCDWTVPAHHHLPYTLPPRPPGSGQSYWSWPLH